MKTYKPTSPSRRQMTTIEYDQLSKVDRFKPLTKGRSKAGGRNHHGRITMRHQGGGNKRAYRTIEFGQAKLNVPGRVETLEYDPYRTCFIARIVYRDGDRRYIVAAKELKVGNSVLVADSAPLTPSNRMKLKQIPIGYLVHNVELVPSGGGRLARSAGSYVEVLGQDGGQTDLKLGSGEVRKVSSECFASVGQLSNPDHNLVNIGKAGRSRWLGIRPTTRAKAMNPVDHKYGGGEGSTQRGTRRPKDIWGNITGGRKTRKRKKWSNRLIIQRRPKK